MFKINLLDKLSFILVLLGSLNWGSIGLFNTNLLRTLSFNSPIAERTLYILISLSAINLILLIFRILMPKKTIKTIA